MTLKLSLMSHEITVREVSEGNYPDNQQIGESEMGAGEITILEGLHRDVFSQTLLHEIIHMIDFMQYIKLSERQVQCLANGLHSLLKDNPQFLEILKKD